MAQPLTGLVVRVKRDKGFGFIKSPTGQEYFFHADDLVDTAFDHLQEGATVTFHELPGRPGKGPRAANITVG